MLIINVLQIGTILIVDSLSYIHVSVKIVNGKTNGNIQFNIILAFPYEILMVVIAGLQMYIFLERTCVQLSHYFGQTKQK